MSLIKEVFPHQLTEGPAQHLYSSFVYPTEYLSSSSCTNLRLNISFSSLKISLRFTLIFACEVAASSWLRHFVCCTSTLPFSTYCTSSPFPFLICTSGKDSHSQAGSTPTPTSPFSLLQYSTTILLPLQPSLRRAPVICGSTCCTFLAPTNEAPKRSKIFFEEEKNRERKRFGEGKPPSGQGHEGEHVECREGEKQE